MKDRGNDSATRPTTTNSCRLLLVFAVIRLEIQHGCFRQILAGGSKPVKGLPVLLPQPLYINVKENQVIGQEAGTDVITSTRQSEKDQSECTDNVTPCEHHLHVVEFKSSTVSDVFVTRSWLLSLMFDAINGSSVCRRCYLQSSC